MVINHKKVGNKMLNVLMRTSNRPKGFKRMLNSIMNQTFKDINLAVSCDTDESEAYVKASGITNYIRLQHTPKLEKHHNPYNMYFNELLKMTKEGWIFFVDDDDVLPNLNTFNMMNKYLVDPTRIYIFRMSIPKERRKIPDRNFGKAIVQADISTPNFIHHTNYIGKSAWPDRAAGDFTYISTLVNNVGMDKVVWVDEVNYVVDFRNGHGLQKDIPV